MVAETDLFDRALLTRRRARMAQQIPNHDFLLRRAAEELGDRLDAVLRDFPHAVNLGAYHGVLGRLLAARDSVGFVVDAEACLPLLRQCGGARIACHEDALPFATQSVDLVVSALGLHLVNDVPGALLQIRHCLKPDGLFLAAVLGGRTLSELRAALTAAESELHGGAGPRVAPFADVRDYGALLQRAGFALPVTDAELVTVTYKSALELMRDLRAMGAGNVLRARPRRPFTRRTLWRTTEIYAERFPADGNRVAATFEIVYLTGWAPDASQQVPLRPGTAKTRLADALGVEEVSAGEKANPSPGPKSKDG